MTVLEAIFYGALQGIAEFLPISSSGHLALMQNFFGKSSEGYLAFNVLLHFGTLIAVFIMYRKDAAELIKGFGLLAARPFKKGIKNPLCFSEKLFLMLCAATAALVPAAVFEGKVEALAGVSWAVGVLLIVNGALLFVSDKLNRGSETLEGSSIRRPFFIGLFQLIGIAPGISRSGITITGGLFNGLKREDAIRFSFLMSIPAVLGANALVLLKDGKELFADGDLSLCFTGMAVSALVGVFAIKLLQVFARRKNFTFFAVYCVLVGIAAVIGDFINGAK